MSKWGRYRSRKNGIKGPAFASFFSQETPAPRKQYLAHSKMRAALRNLRHECTPIFKLKDEATLAAIERCKHDVSLEPEPLYAQLHLMRAALEAANGTSVTWAESMNYLLDKFDLERHTSGSMETIGGRDEQGSDDAREGARHREQDQLDADDRQEGILDASA